MGESRGADTAVRISSIHDEEPGRKVLSFDYQDVFQALGPAFFERRWCVMSLDAFGDDRVEALCDAVAASGPAGVWFAAPDLLEVAGRITQTVDGTVLGFPIAIPPETISPSDLNLARFPHSKADLAILAVDSSYFEVYSKEAVVQEALERRFQDWRVRDPADYFVDE